MKSAKIISIAAVALTLIMSAPAMAQTKAQSTDSQREEKREERLKRRAERLEQFKVYLDSVILSRNYQFNPQTMERLVAGDIIQINNANYNLAVWGEQLDVCLPYIKGFTPPYYTTVLNYTAPQMFNYTAMQTTDGWHITFSATFYARDDYSFTLDVYPSTGGATLNIDSPWFNTVQYTGTLTGLY